MYFFTVFTLQSLNMSNCVTMLSFHSSDQSAEASRN